MNHRKFKWVVSITVLTVLAGILLYVGPVVLYFYRADALISFITHDQNPLNPSEWGGMCRPTQDEVDAWNVARGWECTNRTFLHSSLRTTIYEVFPKGKPNGIFEVGMHTALPRAKVEPLILTVTRNVSDRGTGYTIVPKPGTNVQRGVEILLQQHAELNLHLRYKCALPFVTCQGYEDFLSLTP